VTIAGLKSVQQRFLALNRDRLSRLEAVLPPRQRVLVEVLALLFHTNHPSLPGFVSKDSPCGISGYQPPHGAIAAAARLARSFDYRRQAPRTYDLHALYLMGSAGTLAYSDRSDFDVWLCHREDLAPSAREALGRKAQGVSDWAAAVGLEVHFFVLSAGEVRGGRYQALSRESSGSAQAHLLLDEFYRTGILLAGRQPLWWFVPPEHEPSYEAYAAELLRQRFVDPGEVLDFGGLTAIPPSEFLGAALWQLYKGVTSPYKSLLKILLLEAYASEYPEPSLLSSRFKAAVYGGTRELDRLDPYALMLDKVEGYLRQLDDQDRLELARRCLYLKTGLRLGRGRPAGDEDLRASHLRDLVRGWGWTPAHLLNLDLRPQWKVERVLEERQLLVRALTHSYRLLSAFARRHSHGTAISQHDMTVLGRRLFAAFEQRAGKVQWLGQGTAGQLTESHLQLQHVRHDGEEGWLLFRATGSPEGGRLLPALKRTRTLMEALAWCHFNGVATPQTQVVIDDPTLAHDVSHTLAALRRTFPDCEPTEPPVEALSAPSRPVSLCLVLNLGVDPLDSYTRQGLHLTTERLDPLNYGAVEENLCQTIDAVQVTSWNEVFVRRHEGAEGLLQCLCEYLGHACAGRLALATHCFTPYRGPTIAGRIRALLEEAARTFADPTTRAHRRWLLKVGDLHFAVEFRGDHPSAERIGAREDLLAYLGEPLPAFCDTRFDQLTLPQSALPIIYRANTPGRVQIFFRPRGSSAELFVLDEHGALFHDTLPLHEEAALLSPLARFLEAVQLRQMASGLSRAPSSAGEPVEVYRLGRDERGDLTPLRLPQPGRATVRPYLEVKVIAEGGGPDAVRVLCDDLEFSSLEHGPEVYARVAEHIMARRASMEPYRLYVTDVDLPAPSDPKGPHVAPTTVRYLRYKAEVEQRLNRALTEREAPRPRVAQG